MFDRLTGLKLNIVRHNAPKMQSVILADPVLNFVMKILLVISCFTAICVECKAHQ